MSSSSFFDTIVQLLSTPLQKFDHVFSGDQFQMLVLEIARAHPGEQLVQVGTGEFPFERVRDAFVVTLVSTNLLDLVELDHTTCNLDAGSCAEASRRVHWTMVSVPKSRSMPANTIVQSTQRSVSGVIWSIVVPRRIQSHGTYHHLFRTNSHRSRSKS